MLVMHRDVNLMMKLIHFPMFYFTIWYLVNIIQLIIVTALEKNVGSIIKFHDIISYCL